MDNYLRKDVKLVRRNSIVSALWNGLVKATKVNAHFVNHNFYDYCLKYIKNTLNLLECNIKFFVIF
jgi:hypothetical protein